MDARTILRSAQEHLQQRAHVRLHWHLVTTEWLTTPAWGSEPTQWTLEGELALCSGRWRHEARSETGSSKLLVWDGALCPSLSGPVEPGGQNVRLDRPFPRIPEPHFGLWLLTGQLDRVPAEAAALSVFEHLLQFADDADLAAGAFTQTAGADGTDTFSRQVVCVTGRVPWAEYEIWIDPARDFNLSRLAVTPVRRPDDHDAVQFETLKIDISQLPDGRWFPTGSKLRYRMSLDAVCTVPSHDCTFCDDVELRFTAIESISPSAPDALFDIT
jgi:hypothetical protein